MDLPARKTDRKAYLADLRRTHPVFSIEGATTVYEDGKLRITFSFATGHNSTFAPSVSFDGLTPDEARRAGAPTAQRIIRALGIVESFSYWKAFCSPTLEVGLPAVDEAELGWWAGFWPAGMGEFFYRNDIDYTQAGFLQITNTPSAQQTPPPASGTAPAPHEDAPSLVMFSGGKDSLALTYAAREDETSATDFFLCNPIDAQRELAESLANGGRILEVRRDILPELLALNAEGHPNGHTPYSAYLALAALLAGHLRGSPLVLAGNSRSDDEPNVRSYRGHPVNHQWTKSKEFERALQEYEHRWLPDAPLYCSPLRPLFELQIIQSLGDHLDAFLHTASCNKTKGLGWCQECAKCAWVFLATSALFGHDLAVEKVGGDLFADLGLTELYEAMAGFRGAKPFECTGTEDEVRAAIQAAGQKLGDNLPALTSCLARTEIQHARSLDDLLQDWGKDDLMPPALRALVRKAAHLPPATDSSDARR